MVCGGGVWHAWGMVWGRDNRCDSSQSRPRAVFTAGALSVNMLLVSTRMHVQATSQLGDFDGNAAMAMVGGAAVLGSMPGAAQVRTEGCCFANVSV